MKSISMGRWPNRNVNVLYLFRLRSRTYNVASKEKQLWVQPLSNCSLSGCCRWWRWALGAAAVQPSCAAKDATLDALFKRLHRTQLSRPLKTNRVIAITLVSNWTTVVTIFAILVEVILDHESLLGHSIHNAINLLSSWASRSFARGLRKRVEFIKNLQHPRIFFLSKKYSWNNQPMLGTIKCILTLLLQK